MGRASRGKKEHHQGRASGTKAAARAASEPPVKYGFFLVAYVDLLGQQNELMKLVALPPDTQSRDEVMKVLQRTAGRVKGIRDSFANFITEASRNVMPLTAVPEAMRSDFQALRTLTFRQIGFSDSFVISVPLADQKFGPAKPSMSVWATLHAVAGIWLSALAAGVPLRAGIDVERGTDLFEGEVYGPALINAYRLESEVAEYPRVAVGEGLMDYLTELSALGSFRYGALAVDNAAKCRSLICSAPDDGQLMLDAFAPEVFQLNPELKEQAPKAAAFVASQIDHFKMADPRLARRYQRLMLYFTGRGYPRT